MVQQLDGLPQHQEQSQRDTNRRSNDRRHMQCNDARGDGAKPNHSFSLGDQVPHAAQRVDLNRGVDLSESLAQPMDIDFDRVGADLLR